MEESHFHVFATLPTEEIFTFPVETFRKENFKIAVHPTGGDIHFMHKSTERKEQLQHLKKIKSALIHADSRLRWVSSTPKCSFMDLGKFGVASWILSAVPVSLQANCSKVAEDFRLLFGRA